MKNVTENFLLQLTLGVLVFHWIIVFQGDKISCGGSSCLQNFRSQKTCIWFSEVHADFEQIYRVHACRFEVTDHEVLPSLGSKAIKIKIYQLS